MAAFSRNSTTPVYELFLVLEFSYIKVNGLSCNIAYSLWKGVAPFLEESIQVLLILDNPLKVVNDWARPPSGLIEETGMQINTF